MWQVSADAAEEFARRLSIVHQETGEIQPFVLSTEQRIVLRAIEQNSRVVVLKGRQVYVSTCCCLYALLFAAINPGVKVAVVADIREKAEGLLARIASWAKEADIPTTTSNTRRIVLGNGAEIHALTANSADTGSVEVKAGRSFSYGLIILSEFAFYFRDSALLASLTRSLLSGGHIVIETTATPAENAFRSIWVDGKGWEKVFLSVEQHDAYQLPPGRISNETWEELQSKYGFSSRSHAAYWYQMMTVDLNGDVNRALREAPVLPEHAFSFAEGRWIFRHDRVEPIDTSLVGKFARDIDGGWRIYKPPSKYGVVFGVDTATGLGADASAIAVLDRLDGSLVATWCSRDVQVPDFEKVIEQAIKERQPAAVVVEVNGIGRGVYQAIGTTGTSVIEHVSSDAEKPQRMHTVKMAIESGAIQGSDEIEYEIARSVMLKPRRANGGPIWDGPDDVINAIGFALMYVKANAVQIDRQPVNERTHMARRRRINERIKRLL